MGKRTKTQKDTEMKFERKANDYADYTRKIIRSFGILLDTKTQLYNGALYNCVYTSAKCKYQKSSGISQLKILKD